MWGMPEKEAGLSSRQIESVGESQTKKSGEEKGGSTEKSECSDYDQNATSPKRIKADHPANEMRKKIQGKGSGPVTAEGKKPKSRPDRSRSERQRRLVLKRMVLRGKQIKTSADRRKDSWCGKPVDMAEGRKAKTHEHRLGGFSRGETTKKGQKKARRKRYFTPQTDRHECRVRRVFLKKKKTRIVDTSEGGEKSFFEKKTSQCLRKHRADRDDRRVPRLPETSYHA